STYRDPAICKDPGRAPTPVHPRTAITEPNSLAAGAARRLRAHRGTPPAFSRCLRDRDAREHGLHELGEPVAGCGLRSEAMTLLGREGGGDGAELGSRGIALERLEVGEQHQERRLVCGDCGAVPRAEERPGRDTEICP